MTEENMCLIGRESTHPAEHEFGDAPVRVVRLVQYRDAYVTVVNGESVRRPVSVALFSTLLDATSEHDDRTTVTLPNHSPKVVAGRVQRTLGDDELPRRIVALFNTKNQTPGSIAIAFSYIPQKLTGT